MSGQLTQISCCGCANRRVSWRLTEGAYFCGACGRLASVLLRAGERTVEELAQITMLHRAQLQKHLSTMLDSGVVTRERVEARGAPYRYRLHINHRVASDLNAGETHAQPRPS